MADYTLRVVDAPTQDALRAQETASATPKEYEQRIYPQAPYNAIEKVVCARIPSQYVAPGLTGEVTLDTSGWSIAYVLTPSEGEPTSATPGTKLDVTDYSSVTVDISDATKSAAVYVLEQSRGTFRLDGVRTIRKAPCVPRGSLSMTLYFEDAETVQERAFYKNPASTVNLRSCKRVEREAFAEMSHVNGTCISMPRVEYIGAYAFRNSTLEELEMDYVTRVPDLGEGAFSGCTELTIIRIPAALYDAFCADPSWAPYSRYFRS